MRPGAFAAAGLAVDDFEVDLLAAPAGGFLEQDAYKRLVVHAGLLEQLCAVAVPDERDVEPVGLQPLGAHQEAHPGKGSKRRGLEGSRWLRRPRLRRPQRRRVPFLVEGPPQ